jgi:hypothetical protein
MLSTEAISAWGELYPLLPAVASRNVLIIMAGNIPLVGVHDLVCVLAAGHRAMVKPSSKDFENMSWVVGQLLDIFPDLPLEMFSSDSPAPDAVIAMGSNTTVAAISRQYGEIPMLLRGNRSSLAVLSGDESVEELAALADDVVSFSGLGCRNVSLVFVPRDYVPTDFAKALRRRKGSVGVKFGNNYRQVRAMLKMGGTPHIDCDVCALIEGSDFPSEPTIVNYAYYDNLSEVKDWVSVRDSEIQCVALPPVLIGAGIHQRAVLHGRTQRPLLNDYPDGRDTMQFLTTI